MKTADEILQAKKCGDIFSRNNKDTVILEYREMVKAFHPDICTLPNAEKITARLNELYETALRLIGLGTWEISNVVEFRATNGKRYTSRYLRQATFELGEQYLSDTSVTYVFASQHTRFFENAVNQIRNLRYASSRMEQEFSRYLPKIRYDLTTLDGRKVLILEKSSDVFLLSDVQKAFGGKIPDRHVAWIISRLCNLCCFFDFSSIAHNGLTLDTCFISPQYHTLLPLGGWWYAREIGQSLIGVPRCIYDVMPIKAKSDKISACQTDLEAAKLIGRQLIDPSTAPQPIMDFLNTGSSKKATDEFEKWNKTLDAAYGKRQFVEMKISKSEIYQ